MANIEFIDNSTKVIDKLDSVCISWLYEAGGEMQTAVQRNTKVDTGQLKGSWKYDVNEPDQKVTVGSHLENAIWEEFGTGQYALHGDGRKTPWKYQDRNGKWHTTIGKHPRRALFNAFERLKTKLQKALENKLKELN